MCYYVLLFHFSLFIKFLLENCSIYTKTSSKRQTSTDPVLHQLSNKVPVPFRNRFYGFTICLSCFSSCVKCMSHILKSYYNCFNCRMPNCTTVVQTASELFEPQISTKFAQKMTLFGIVQLMVKQRRSLCFAFVCNSTENTGFLKFCRFVMYSSGNPTKIHQKFTK